jgi:hypothetical protein
VFAKATEHIGTRGCLEPLSSSDVLVTEARDPRWQPRLRVTGSILDEVAVHVDVAVVNAAAVTTVTTVTTVMPIVTSLRHRSMELNVTTM